MAKNFDDGDLDSMSQRLMQIKSAKIDSESAGNSYRKSLEMADTQYKALQKGGKLKRQDHWKDS